VARHAHTVLVRTPELLGRPTNTWEDNTRMGIKEKGIYCISLVQDRDKCWALKNTVINLQACLRNQSFSRTLPQ
jgi:hypothetical protein